MLFASLLILALAEGGSTPGWLTPVFFAAMFGVMYFIMIRPQQKQAQRHKAMLASLTKGDEVVTQSGLIGKINAITDRIVTLEVSSGVKVRLLKSSIQGKYSPAPEGAESKDAKDAKESKESKEVKEEK